MSTFTKTTTRLAVLALVIAGLPASAQTAAPAAAPAPAAKPAVAPVAVVAKVDSKGGAQVAADQQKTVKAVAKPAVKVAAAKPKPAEVKPAVVAPAIVAPVVVAPVVEKKPDEPKMVLAITGQFTPEVGFISSKKDEANKDKLQGYNFGWNNAFVQFNGTAKNDYGMSFSAVMRLDASAMASNLVSNVTQDVDKKNNLIKAPQPLPIFNRLFGVVEHKNLGTIQFGNLWGPQFTQQEGGFEILTVPVGLEGMDRPHNPYNTLGTIPGSYANTGGTSSRFAVADPHRNTKMVYISPSLGGFKLSGAFTPRLDEIGSTFPYTNETIGNNSAASRYQNSWMIVPSFKSTFGAVKVALVGTYGGATSVNGDGSAMTGDAALQDPRLWSVSGGIKTMGFELGGQYIDNGVSGLTKAKSDAKMDSGTGWNVAAAYNFEKSKVGVMYMATSRALSEGDAAKVSCLTVYANYQLAPGVKAVISENYLTGTAATKDASKTNLEVASLGSDTTSNVVYVGLDITF